MPTTFVRDKDAVTSAAYIADVAAVAAANGQGLYELLQELFKRFGYFAEGAKSLVLPGADGAAKIEAMMNGFRDDPPRTIGGIAVAAVADLMTGENKDVQTGQVISRFDLPAASVIFFTLDDGTKVIVRPSGTEPKIKFYVLTSEPGDDLDRAEQSAAARIEAIVADLVKRAE